jgi:3-dehydro-4-phosphotetronate decarboxylase
VSFGDTNFGDTARTQMVQLGAALYDRGLTPGRTGNLSVRTAGEIMITPTNACLGRLDPDRLAVTTIDGEHVSGDRPSKELVLHESLDRNHPTCSAVAHLHSTPAVAVSCNHGSLAAAPSLESAVDVAEEIEETARLYLLLEGRSPAYLREEAVAELHRRFPPTA